MHHRSVRESKYRSHASFPVQLSTHEVTAGGAKGEGLDTGSVVLTGFTRREYEANLVFFVFGRPQARDHSFNPAPLPRRRAFASFPPPNP